MTLVPRTATIDAGQVVVITARLVDEFGDPLRDVRVTWSSSNEKVATVNVNGTVMGRSEGRAAITARSRGRALSSAIHVIGEETRTKGKPKP